MKCETCPDQLVCWSGLITRFPCGICHRVELHYVETVVLTAPAYKVSISESRVTRILLRACPRDNPAPIADRFNGVICHICRVKGNYPRLYNHHPYSPEYAILCPRDISYTVENE